MDIGLFLVHPLAVHVGLVTPKVLPYQLKKRFSVNLMDPMCPKKSVEGTTANEGKTFLGWSSLKMSRVLSVKCVRSGLENHDKGLEVSGLPNHSQTAKSYRNMRTHKRGKIHVTSEVALEFERSLR